MPNPQYSVDNPIPEDNKPGEFPSADALNRLARLVNSITGTKGIRVIRRLGRIWIEGTGAAGKEEITEIWIAGGRKWAKATWTLLVVPPAETGVTTGYLKCPYDGTTAPSYVSQTTHDAFAWTAMPEDDGTDERANALYIRLADWDGPTFLVHRA